MNRIIRKAAFVALLAFALALGSCAVYSEATRANIDITVQTTQPDQGGTK